MVREWEISLVSASPLNKIIVLNNSCQFLLKLVLGKNKKTPLWFLIPIHEARVCFVHTKFA